MSELLWKFGAQTALVTSGHQHYPGTIRDESKKPAATSSEFAMNTGVESENDRSLDQWIDYIQTLHQREIDLSLERVRSVYERMYPNGLAYKIVNIAGTNGKGSTAELMASIYREAGYKVGKFTSPHLVEFNERFNLNGQPVSDQLLLDAFDCVETYRQDTPITFFEYGTLLAIELFAKANVDIAVMEIGLGGRLDSVNILDPDAAIVTSISVDHTAWLGNTIEQIAYEKVGIARPETPLVIGLIDAPQNMLNYANEIGAELSQIGQNFSYAKSKVSDTWDWIGSRQTLKELPLPYQQGGVQLSNCSLALQAIDLLDQYLPVSAVQAHSGIANAMIEGRCQVISREPLIVLDVSHNESSVSRLAEFIESAIGKSTGKIIAVCGMLKDKEISVSLGQIADQVDTWHLAGIANDRGANSDEIAEHVRAVSIKPQFNYQKVELAYDAAVKTLTADDCLVVFGSFHIVGDILAHVRKSA